MPEGDTLENLARWLGPELVGARLVGVRLRPHGEVTSLRGRTVVSVQAIGKNLVVRFDDERSLIVHLGMHGRWRRQARGTRTAPSVSVAIETESAVFVCTRARRVDLVASKWESRHPGLERLGPDLLDDECDMTAIVERARRSPAPTAAELLLDQRVAAGIGNVYKSEALFLERTHPGRRPATLSDDALAALYSRARELMRANLRPGGRVTVRPTAAPRRVPKSERYWVYRRSGAPCRRCGTAIELARHGDEARSSYFCPRCQPLDGGREAEQRSRPRISERNRKESRMGIASHEQEQAELWNGDAGHAWVEAEGILDQMLAPFVDILAAAVRAGSSANVLDVGCGTGATTLAIASRLDYGECTGIDISAPMIARAQERAASERARVTFIVADAQTYPFEASGFDAIVSRFGVMFFDDSVRAFTNLRRAAKRGGELRFVAWRSPDENPFMTTAERAAASFLPSIPPRRADAPGQFAFADAERVRRMLQESGWTGIDIQPVDVRCTFPEHGLRQYVTRLGPLGRILTEADDRTRAEIVEAVRAAFDRYVHGADVRFDAACWLAVARAPS